ncbi:hypothetical protein, partial [Microbispora bryophytorum]
LFKVIDSVSPILHRCHQRPWSEQLGQAGGQAFIRSTLQSEPNMRSRKSSNGTASSSSSRRSV